MATYAVVDATAAAPFIPELWAQKALDIFRSKIVLAKHVARSTDYDEREEGDVLHIPFPGTWTSGAIVPGELGTISTPQNARTADVPLNQHRGVNVVIADYAQAQANGDLMERYLKGIIIPIVEDVEKAIYACAQTATPHLTTSPIGVADARMSAATLRLINKTFIDQKVDLSEVFVSVSTDDHMALLGDTTLQYFFANASPESIKAGELGVLYGINTFVSQLVPVVEGVSQNLALHKESVILAMRPFKNAATPGAEIATVSDPESGLVVRVGGQYRADLRGLYLFVDVLFGVGLGRPEIGFTVLSGDSA